jgi:predicted dehydrogenase
MSQEKLGLGIVGTNDLRFYLEVLEELPEINIVGIGGLPNDHGEGLFEDNQVQTLLIISPIEEYKYWFQRALESGKDIISHGPLGHSYQDALALEKKYVLRGNQWFMLTDSLVCSWEKDMEISNELKNNPVLYFDLEVSIPKIWLQTTRGSILNTFGLGALSIIGTQWGKVDSVYAHTRSLGLNKPEEDTVNALLKLRNGVEGTVRMIGLGGKAQASLNVWGEESHAVFEHALSKTQDKDDIKAQLKSMLSNTRPNTLWSENRTKQLRALRLSEWIQRSARLNREIFFSEIR